MRNATYAVDNGGKKTYVRVTGKTPEERKQKAIAECGGGVATEVEGALWLAAWVVGKPTVDRGIFA